MISPRALSAALLFALVAAAGCSDRQTSAAAAPAPAAAAGPTLPIGSECTVQFRRDALGGAASTPVGPLTNQTNGATVSLSGKLAMIDAEFVVIERPEDTLWVPRASVLLLQFRKQQ